MLANVLHRVGEPLKILSELHRVLRPGGRTFLSNSYDWAELITVLALWFDDVKDVVHRSDWNIDFELDYVPYWSPVSTRKSTVAYNRAVSTNILHFRARVLAVYGQRRFIGSR